MNCLYHRTGSPQWACSCQPPTVWGPSYLFHCDCCQLPTADKAYSLCDMCSRHQNEMPSIAELDHRSLIDEDVPAKASARSLRAPSAPSGAGRGFLHARK